ncbi:DUF4188 domain-containing protein [soil metagenome]
MADKPSHLRPGRFCDAHDGPVIVFLVGMRINRLHRPDKWLPVSRAMPRMLNELAKQPDLGLLGHELMLAAFRTLITLQYWRDFDALHAYAHASEAEHLPAWGAFNRASKGNDAVGIFHETYIVQPGAHECVYVDMPLFGLGKASGIREATGKRNSARERLA